MNDIGRIIEENNRRNAELDAPYDPIIGIGGPIERQEVKFSDLPAPMYLPVEMLNVDWVNYLSGFNSIEDASKETNSPIEGIINDLSNERFKHDFEFWTATTVKIKPKSGGDLINFVMNRPQRKIHEITYKQILNEEPIRQILLKSRQFGGSTYYQIFMGYIQIIHKTSFNSLIAAHLNQAATSIRFMFSTLAKYYPKGIESSFTLKGFEGTKNIKQIPERNCKLTIGSIETPDSIRSDDVALSHLSEIGLWKKTEGKEPGDLAQSILGTMPTVPWSMYVLESTAKGIGNYFHQTWLKAVSGENVLKPVFIPWHEDPKNRIKFKTDKERNELARTLTDYEYFLWDIGATLEGIKFYRYKLNEMNGDEWRMKSEFPTTAEEAFQSSGHKVFSPSYIEALREDCQEPTFKGDVFADARRGEKALQNIRFDETKEGSLWVWTLPDKSEEIENRYCAFADIGGRSKNADYSVIKVFDRYWMQEGGSPEVVAVWHGHLDQDLFAWKCAQICTMYDNALLAIEVNSLSKEKADSEGEHFLTVLDEIAPYYKNLFARNDPEKIGDSYIPKYGFHTNVKTKSMIINSLNAAARERYLRKTGEDEGYHYVERDFRATNEMASYEVKPDGSLNSVEGTHDDHVIVTAGGIWLATSFMPLPKHKNTGKGRRRRKLRSEASF